MKKFIWWNGPKEQDLVDISRHNVFFFTMPYDPELIKSVKEIFRQERYKSGDRCRIMWAKNKKRWRVSEGPGAAQALLKLEKHKDFVFDDDGSRDAAVLWAERHYPNPYRYLSMDQKTVIRDTYKEIINRYEDHDYRSGEAEISRLALLYGIPIKRVELIAAGKDIEKRFLFYD